MTGNYSSYTDNELVTLLKRGDELALAEIYKRYQGVLYSHAFRRLPDREEVRDIIHELFTNLWSKRDNLILTTSLSAYLYASVRNRVINQFRNKKVRNTFAESLAGFIEKGEYVVDEQIRERELIALIEKEVAALPKQMRIVFEMSRTLDLTHRQIAEELNVSPNTVRNQIHSAIKILRIKLGANALYLFF
jgi:RNA polymerase sigma-70 factor (family 1)